MPQRATFPLASAFLAPVVFAVCAGALRQYAGPENISVGSLQLSAKRHKSRLRDSATTQIFETGNKSADDACAGTTAYAFIAADNMSLEAVWRAYFDGCPKGSYTIHIHSQAMQKPPMLSEARLLADPVLGNPRFNYKMQEITLRLYRDAYESTAPNGCKPRWVQLLSEKCAPIRSCETTQGFLATHANVSFIGDGDHRGFADTPPYPWVSRKPKAWDKQHQKFLKQSQWDTVWMGHVQSLLAREAENRPLWNTTHCPDEHYTVNILTALGANIVRRNLTYGLFETGWDSVIHSGHPLTLSCAAPTGGASAGNDSRTATNHTAGFTEYLPNDDIVLPDAAHVAALVSTESAKLKETQFKIQVKDALAAGALFMRKFDRTCVAHLKQLVSDPTKVQLGANPIMSDDRRRGISL